MARKNLSTVLIRIQGGRIAIMGCSGDFPFPSESLPEDGSACPAGTGAYGIINGRGREFMGKVPLERWVKPGYFDEGRYILKEHSLLLTGQILTLLEIEERDLSC